MLSRHELGRCLRRPLSSSSNRKALGSTYDVIRISPNSKTISKSERVNIRSILTQNQSSIHARDILSLSIADNKPGRPLILPRGEAVIVSLDHVKAIIFKDEALLFNASFPNVQLFASEVHRQCLDDADEFKSNFPKLSAGSLEEENSPLFNSHRSPKSHEENPTPQQQFEMLFLEEALREICTIWRRRVQLIKPVVDSLLDNSDGTDGHSEDLHRLVPLKDSLQSFEMKVSESIECVVELLQSEEDMLGLMLSEQEKCKRLNQPIDPTSHESTELLLEDYNRQLNGILHDITFLQKRVQTKQELAAIGLDAYRNRMIRMNVQLAVGSVCLSTMTVVAGFFGMNLVSGLENSESMFFLTVGGSAAASTVLYGTCHNYLSGRTMQKRVEQRASEISSITSVLNNMNSLDHAIKMLLSEAEKSESNDYGVGKRAGMYKKRVTKAKFKEILNQVRNHKEDEEQVSDGEVDLIFSILDQSGDDFLDTNELRKLKKELALSEEERDV